MSLFALIHGSMHGGWCWQHLARELEQRGHEVLAPDLPCDDPEAGLAEYAATVEVELGNASDAILVGHSLGGRTLPVIASRRSVSRMVFLCCVPIPLGPVEPDAFAQMVTAEYASAQIETRADGARRMVSASARDVFFNDCDEETARWAAAALRWQTEKPLSEPSPIARWPDVPLGVILTRDDRAVRLDWALQQARKWLSGADPILLHGSHSPFLSRPAALADVLVEPIPKLR